MTSYLRTTWTHILYTPIPSSVSPIALINLLHDHDALIHLSPIVTRSTLLSPAAESNPPTSSSTDLSSTTKPPTTTTFALAPSLPTHHVHERIPLLSLPFGLGKWTTEISFKVQFTDTETGVQSLIHAPMGLMSVATYVVCETEIAKADAGGEGVGAMVVDEHGEEVRTEWVMVETIMSESSVLFKRFVDADMLPTRRAMGRSMMERLEGE